MRQMPDAKPVRPENPAEADFAASGGTLVALPDGKRFGWKPNGRVLEVFESSGGEVRQIGGAIDAGAALGLIGDRASGKSAERAERFRQWMDEKEAGCRSGASMREAGFSFWHTGGGCTAWGKALDDGTELMVTTTDADADGDPEGSEWLIGRYDEDGGFVQVTEPVTLAEAIEQAATLPAPAELDGAGSQTGFATAEEAASKVSRPRLG